MFIVTNKTKKNVRVGTFFAYKFQKDTFMQNFSDLNLYELLHILKKQIANTAPHDIIEFILKDPDYLQPSKAISYKSIVDLAQILQCRMLTPKQLPNQHVLVRLYKLQTQKSFHKESDIEQKYGNDSIFSTIDKNNQTSFLHYYLESLKNVNIPKKARILNLGINSGEEFEIIKKDLKDFSTYELVGIDYCKSAIQKAKQRFQNDKNITFYQHNINHLDSLKLGTFDLIISIATLQSTTLNFKQLFMEIVQKHLHKNGSIILGFPNCRWIDSEMIYGAKVKNYNFSEMGLLYSDVIFCKKYLQQKKFRVMVTGKDYLFLSGVSILKF